MPYKLPKKSDAYEFERMCRDVLNAEYKNQGIEFRARGRSGQAQNGIDIFSRQFVDDGTKRIVAQCKNYTDSKEVVKAVSDAIDKDIKKMSGLKYGVKLLYVMTSADYDIKLQDYIDELNERVDFEVDIKFWEDIEEAVLDNDELIDKYYPDYSRPKATDTIVHEYTDRRLDQSDVKDYYDDMVRIWEEEPGVERIIGKESLLNAYIESKRIVNGERKPILAEIQRLFMDMNNHVILLHGQPGHGKTTFCHFAIYQYVKKQALQDYKNVFLFSLNPSHSKIIEDKKVILQNALCFDKNGPCITLEECRHSLIFLDGYDELKTQTNATDLTSITKLVEEVMPLAKKYDIHFVITSRTVAVKDELEDESMKTIPVLEFADLSEDEQRDWIYSEKRPESERESLKDYWENTLKNVFTDQRLDDSSSATEAYNSMRELLGIPIIFRMVVHKRYANAQNAKNKAMLYEKLFDLTLDHRLGVDNSKEDKKAAYEKLAHEIFMHNEDTAVLKDRADAKKELMYYYYLSEKENADLSRREIGFIHRSFYQYFFAEFLYRKLMNATTDEQAERFLGCLGSRRIDDDIREFFCQISDNHPENLEQVTECARRVIEILAQTSGIVEENLKKKKTEGSDAEVIPLKRSNHVFVNAINLCITFDINKIFAECKDLQYFMRKYDCDSIILRNKFIEEKYGRRISIDLSFADLSSANMSFANLNFINMNDANMSFANLNYANLTFANLSSANLNFANMSYTNLSVAYLRRAYLSSANLRNSYMNAANLSSANLNSVNLSCSDLSFANLKGASLNSAYMKSANMHSSNLTFANLSFTNMNFAYLNNADLSFANLNGADLSGAVLNNAKLTSTYFDKFAIKNKPTFPLPSLADAKFDYIYVDGDDDAHKYSRKEFFAKFQPEVEDHMDED